MEKKGKNTAAENAKVPKMPAPEAPAMDKPATDGMTPEETRQIEAWKSKYGKVFCYEVEGERLYFKQPDRKTLAAAGVIAKNDPMKYNEFVLKNSLLDGNAALLDDNSVFYGLAQIMDELVAAKIGELKNL